jgi:hypothetical protein
MLIYGVALTIVQWAIIEGGLRPDEHALWLYTGGASLLFGSKLLNPYFTPPADSATNAFAMLSALLAAGLTVQGGSPDAVVLSGAIAFATGVLVLALAVLLIRPPAGALQPSGFRVASAAVQHLGSPNVIFTIVILVAVWLFHREKAVEVYWILGSYALIGLWHPVERLVGFVRWTKDIAVTRTPASVVGHIAAYQTPNIVLIRQTSEAMVVRGSTLLVAGEAGVWRLGIALNYVGRDEGNLLRVLTSPLPAQVQELTAFVGVTPTAGFALELAVPDDDKAALAALQHMSRLCGIVDSDTTSDLLRFEVIDDKALTEGRLVETQIAEHEAVLFQIVEGVTHEEVVQQKSKYGYARATARKIGRWDPEAQKFVHVPWMPRINSPVFLRDAEAFDPDPGSIGHFPQTPYGVSVSISEAVTHNTAVLGILGVGKTYLALELVERMLAKGIKVVILDLTNQYEKELAAYLDSAAAKVLHDRLVAAGKGGGAAQNREDGGSKSAFNKEIIEQLRAFMEPGNAQRLRIINPSQYRVTRQPGFREKDGSAELVNLTISEITGLVSNAALQVCQALGMTEQARLCLVYEEAHSLIPEKGSVAASNDEKATAVSARAILQGRKFGLGCVVITQRTANVTKSILNQCNTVFALRMFDQTGKEFLSNYVGSDYAAVLPNLAERHAILFGKASCCENPVLVRLNDRDAFEGAFRQAYPPPAIDPLAAVDGNGLPPADVVA